MRKFRSVVEAVLLTTVILCCLIAVALIISNVQGVRDLASWAQAIGGVAAIVAAFLVGLAQSKATIEAVRMADALASGRRSKALLAVADEIAKLASQANEVYATRNLLWIQLTADEYSRPLQTLLDELAEIRAHEFGSSEVLSQVVSLKVAASYLKVMIDRMPAALAAWEGVDCNQNLFDHLKDVISINRQLISRATASLRGLLVS